MRNRSVIEIMVLTFTFLVAFSVISVGAIVAIVEWNSPATDTTRIVESLTSIISGLIGAMLGLLAGKAETLGSRPDGTRDSVRLPGEES